MDSHNEAYNIANGNENIANGIEIKEEDSKPPAHVGVIALEEGTTRRFFGARTKKIVVHSRTKSRLRESL